MPVVSIVTPSYNSGAFLEGTIKSVLCQSFESWEMLIVDDCSTDDSIDVIQSFVDRDARIKLIRLSANSGAAVARNTAIRKAQGRYIAFLDSDDKWLPHKLERQLSFMKRNNIAFSYAAYEKLDESGKQVGVVSVPLKVAYRDLLKVSSIGCLTAIYDTKKIGKVYMPLIRKRQDLGLWLCILRDIPYAYGINETLAQYQLRRNSISANKADAAKYTWRLYREVEKISLLVAAYYFSHYAINGVIRTKFPRLARALGKL